MGPMTLERQQEPVALSPDTGRPTGSAVTLDQCLQNVINWFDLSLDDAISWASDNPRKILGNSSSKNDFSDQWINWKKMEGMWKVMEVQTGKFKIQNYS